MSNFCAWVQLLFETAVVVFLYTWFYMCMFKLCIALHYMYITLQFASISLQCGRPSSYFIIKRAPSSEFVSSSIPSCQILTAHAQPFRWARDLAFCLKVPLDSLLVWASSGGSAETARMRRLAWTFAAGICDKYQIRLTRPKICHCSKIGHDPSFINYLGMISFDSWQHCKTR